MNQHFRTAPCAENVVLQYAGASRLMDEQGCTIRVLCALDQGVGVLGLWYDTSCWPRAWASRERARRH